jgi:hypothetical protein
LKQFGPIQNRPSRARQPQMTTAKHQLRDWIESRLTPWQPKRDERAPEKQLNDGLKSGRVFCEENAPCGANGQNLIGYLGEVEIHYNGLLRVRTRLGILCGFDLLTCINGQASYGNACGSYRSAEETKLSESIPSHSAPAIVLTNG